MSERRISQEDHSASLESTLFDDSIIDSMADKLGSYDAAYRALGVSPPVYERPEIKTESNDGASVELGARALALHNIMGTYNQLNKAMGARIASQTPSSNFNQRYRYPEEVTEQMGGKASRMIHENEEDFDTLNATSQMLSSGFSTEEVDVQKARLKRDLSLQYGPGKAYAPERAKFVNKLARTAKKINKAA